MRPVVYTATATDQANGFTPPVPVDYNRASGGYAVQYQAAGGGAGGGTVQVSIDSPFNPPAAGMNWSTVMLANNVAFLNGSGATAFRVSGPTAGDIFTVVAQGASAAG